MTHEDASSSIEEAVGAWSPQVIGISVRNIDDQNREQPKFLLPLLKPTIDHCRRLSSAPIVLGGAGYSIFPEAALTYLGASMGIQGEGEVAFLTLLDRLEKGEPLTGVPGLYIQGQGLQASRSYIRNFSEQLTSGFERFTSTYDRQLWVPFQTRRGCPLDCSYCSTATIEGRLVRKRPLTSAMAELIALRNQGFRHFFFVDNTFNLPLSYAKELCGLIIHHRLDIQWRCILYPAKVDDELLALMAEAGCCEVSLGFESGSEQILKAMNKRFKPQDVKRISELIARHGIGQMGFLMLGGPGETRETVMESFTFAASLPLDSLKITQGIRIYPYTKLAQRAVQEGFISPQDDLLKPTFYLVPSLEGWLQETVATYVRYHPQWIA